LTASLNPARSNYITEVFNTDPSKIQKAGHVLYSHYDVSTAQAVITGSGLIPAWITASIAAKSSQYTEEAVFLVTSSLDRNVGSTTIPNLENFSDRFQHAFSPAVISQKIGGKNKNLFTVHMLDAGAFTNTNVKVSIENIRKSKVDDDYGVFDLLVRKFSDGDESVTIVETGETFRGLSLNPSSDNYIARRIGTINKFYDFDKLPASQKIVVDGIHPNKSRYIRVAMTTEVDNGDITKTALPVGFRGPYHLVTSGSDITMDFQHPLTYLAGMSAGKVFARGSITNPGNQIVEPPVPYRTSISDGTGGKKKPNSSYYWGLQTTQVDVATTTNSSRIFNNGISGFTRYYPKFATGQQALWVGANNGTIDSDSTVYDSDKFNNNLFSLEQIQIHTKSTADVVDGREWGFAKYRRSNELTERGLFPKKDGTTDTGRFLNVAKDFGDIASFKYFKFTMPVQGGFDGVNVFDKDKTKLADNAAKREMSDENQGEVNGPTVGAYLKALHIMAEKSDVDIQLLAVPGIRETKITDDAIAKTEGRFDALYIMDMEERDVSNNVVTSSAQEVSVTNTIEDLRGRALDTSFAATYFPDTIIPDPVTKTNVRVPPSVSVLGALSLNDAVAFPWFAPAGFTRGALTNVFDTTVNFNRANLDSLYESDINPITQFPDKKEHVIFGQKTLQAAASSLDRVNVRRLLIDVRRKVRNIADTFIFEPNRADTLARFSAAVNPILAQVQAQQGVERYRVIIDTTTTTQADIENNTVRGKIFMQPTRAVEFIALDFVVTNNGTEI
jgi:phage tail sheath protein FI